MCEVCVPAPTEGGNLLFCVRQAANLEEFLFGAGSAAAEGFGKEQDTFAADELEVKASAALLHLLHSL